MCERRKDSDGEIEVTPEMIEAGSECVFDMSENVIRNIYTAMERVRRNVSKRVLQSTD